MREHGQDFHTRHPVMSPEMIRQLPAGRPLVIRGGQSPVIAALPMCWHDRLYRRARRAGTATAALVAVPEPAVLTAAGPSYFPRPDDRGPAIPSGGFGAPPGSSYPWWDEDVEPA
jgi:hypothetical protein